MDKDKLHIMQLSFRIFEKLLFEREFKTKPEVMNFAHKSEKIVHDSGKYPTELKLAYTEALNKLEALTFEEMQEIKKILKGDD